MAGLTPETPDPTHLVVHQQSRQLEVAFSDGAHYHIPFELLRIYSPSAEVQGHGPGQAILQTGHRLVTIETLSPVGNYAVQPLFSDGHSTGIYSWELLYSLGAQQEELWKTYLESLAQAGVDRDASMKKAAPKGKGCAE